MVIIRDTREKRGFTFLSCAADVTVKAGTLVSGDYSLLGMESMVAIERKSMDDFLQSISTGRERFFRELDRARGLQAFAILVEGDWKSIVHGNYRSQMSPAAASATVAAIMARYGFPVFFAGSHDLAERMAVLFLRQFLRRKEHEIEVFRHAVDDNAKG